MRAALKRHRVSPSLSPSLAPQPDQTPPQRPHSAPIQGSLYTGWVQGPTRQQGIPQQGSSQQPLSHRGFLPAGPMPSSQQTWSEGLGEGVWEASGSPDMGDSLLDGPAAPAVEVAQSQPLLGAASGAGPGAGAGAQGQFHGAVFRLLD